MNIRKEKPDRLADPRFARLTEQTLVGIFLMNVQGRMECVNQKWCAIHGLSPDQSLGDGWLDAIHPEDCARWHQFWQQLSTASTQATFNNMVELRLLTPPEKVTWVVAQVVPEYDEKDQIVGYFGIVSDITEYKRTEEALRSAREDAEAGVRSRSEFLTIMSHEIRTPMNGIIGTLDLLSETRLDGEQRRYLETSRKSSQALLSLLNDILELSVDGQPNSDQTQDVDWFHLLQLIHSVSALFAVRIEESGLTFKLDVASEIRGPLRHFGDARRLRVILMNLVGNAIRFTKQGVIALSVHPAPERGHEFVRFTVTDTGAGIPAEQQEMIFLPFTQLDSSSSRVHGGTGLGLAITKHFVERMGGEISVSSSVGAGSRFDCFLPLPSAPVDAIPTGYTIQPHNTQFYGKVLLVEDDPVNRMLITAMLRKLKLEPDVAVHGRDALRCVDRERYDLILMDCLMPVMDGFATARKIRQKEEEKSNGGHVPIIALTALALKGDRERCLAAGMDGYIAKPVLMVDLETALKQWLSSRGGPSQPKPDRIPFDLRMLGDLRRTLGEEIAPLLQAFIKVLPQRIKNIRKCIARKDAHVLHNEVHSLKSASRQLGLIALANQAMEIDILVRTGKIKKAEKALLILEEDAHKSVRFLEKELHKEHYAQ
jgi:PAS domain S-box-containing protein